jgi:hypothetical protein
LSLEEVAGAGLPAFCRDYGEHLVYLDRRILDTTDGVVLYEAVGKVGGAARAVGLEYGWRQAEHCRCALCGGAGAPVATARGLSARSVSQRAC